MIGNTNPDSKARALEAKQDRIIEAILGTHPSYLAEAGEAEQITGDDASHTLTIPSGTTHVRLAVVGMIAYWNVRGANANATDAPLNDLQVEIIPVLQGTTSLRVYVPTGTTVTASYLTKTAR